jgi:hypothetical protein
MTWHEIAPSELWDTSFRLIGSAWTLIAAITINKWNTRAASWGGLGVLWSCPVSFPFVRPTRYTYAYLEESPFHTLSYFGEEHRVVLTHCGSVLRRDHDKARETGLVPEAIANEGVTFRQERLVILRGRLYIQTVDPHRFVDSSLAAHYPARDYHRLYVGHLEKVLVRQPHRGLHLLPQLYLC